MQFLAHSSVKRVINHVSKGKQRGPEQFVLTESFFTVDQIIKLRKRPHTSVLAAKDDSTVRRVYRLSLSIADSGCKRWREVLWSQYTGARLCFKTELDRTEIFRTRHIPLVFPFDKCPLMTARPCLVRDLTPRSS